MTDPTLAIIANDSPELLKAAGLKKGGDYTYKWLDARSGDYVYEQSAEALLRDAMVKEIWKPGIVPILDVTPDGRYRVYTSQFYDGDTMLAALYAVYLAGGKP